MGILPYIYNTPGYYVQFMLMSVDTPCEIECDLDRRAACETVHCREINISYTIE